LERTLPYVGVWNGGLLDANGQPTFATTSRDATIGWLQWLRALHTNPAVLATPDFSTLDERLQEGRVTSMIDWAHKRPAYEQLWQSAAAVGIAPLPTLRGTPPTTLVRAETAAINTVTTDEQHRAAEAFLRYATGAQAQTRLAEQSRGTVLPAHTGVPVEAHGEAMRVAVEHGQSFTGALDATWQSLDTMINSVVNGGDAGEAVDKASTNIGNRE
jgi:ABC-type glycerol-3-phosphate transport system substrate-binding protein